MQKIVTYLWFDTQAEEAAQFYTSLFKDSEITSVVRTSEAGSGSAGSAMVVNFTLNGQEFIALNGGPQFQFTEAISLFVNCDSQEEVDRLWDALISEGGEPSMCGWLKDRYGLSWQIIPTRLMELMSDPNPAKAGAATQAMLQMQRIEIPKLEAAAAAV